MNKFSIGDRVIVSDKNNKLYNQKGYIRKINNNMTVYVCINFDDYILYNNELTLIK